MKKTIVYIPVTRQQKERFDSIAVVYLQQTPYDYAVFGMRCSAAAYDILGQLNIFPHYSHTKTYKKIFYPKLLRKRLLKKADENGWKVVHEDGSRRRVWKDIELPQDIISRRAASHAEHSVIIRRLL